MKKLSNIEAELKKIVAYKKRVAYKKGCIVPKSGGCRINAHCS